MKVHDCSIKIICISVLDIEGEGGIGFVQGDADLAVKGSKPLSLCQCFSVGLCRWNHRRS